MDFKLTEEQLNIQQNIRKYCQQELAPRASELDSAPLEKTPEMISERLKALAKEGFLGLGFPADAGGSGDDLFNAVLLVMELGEACPATALSVTSSVGLCARALYEWGSPEERKKYLTDLLSGEILGAYGALEPGAGLDSWAVSTTASPAGDGFTLQGEKRMILNAPLAGPHIISASLEEASALFLVAQGAKGLTISPSQDKMGCRGAPTADVTLADCPAARLFAKDGVDTVATLRCHEHFLFGALAMGMLNSAKIMSGVYARDHQIAGKPLGRHQEISFKLADILVFQETAFMLLYRCLWLLKKQPAEAQVLASGLKCFASESVVKAANNVVQIMGQDGYSAGSPGERIYRDAKLMELLGDTTEKHRMFIADQVLAEY